MEQDQSAKIGCKLLCVQCINDEYFKRKFEASLTEGRCTNCGNENNAFKISFLAENVKTVLENLYKFVDYITPAESSALENEVFGWREGYSICTRIKNMLGIDENSANDIRNFLNLNHSSNENNIENPYSHNAFYIKSDKVSKKLLNQWNEFEKELVENSRFFSSMIKNILDNNFKNLKEYEDEDGKSVIVEFGPDTDYKSIFRARSFDSQDSLENALLNVDRELGPPPAHLANEGRMNPRNVSVFYGASDPETAIAEIRPLVGARVIVGEFFLQRKLRLLNLIHLRSTKIRLSEFDDNYTNELYKLEFLKKISNLFSKPISNSDEDTTYLVTQVIADYLRSIPSLSLDGIIYHSSQATPLKTWLIPLAQLSKKKPNCGGSRGCLRLKLWIHTGHVAMNSRDCGGHD